MVYIKCIVEVLLIDVKTVSQHKDIILSMNDLKISVLVLYAV